jgi:hypothetical protein
MRHHFKRFKKINTVVLKKSKKSNYLQLKSYRLIALLDTLSKAFETIVIRCLSDYAEKHNLLSKKQMRVRRDRLIEITLEMITETVHTIWNCNKNNVISLLFLNDAEVFNNVLHARLLYNFRKKRVSSLIIQWMKSFLKDRVISITLKMRTSSMIMIQTRISQKSSISSILFLFFNASLIKACTRTNLLIQTEEFIDDVHLLIYDKSMKRNCKALDKAHKICLKWACIYKMFFALQKYELLHFFRRFKKMNMTMFINFDTTFIELKISIRILELYIDEKLKWKSHIAQLKLKMINQSNTLKCLAESIWEIMLYKTRTMYSMIIWLMFIFAISVWHNSQDIFKTIKKHAWKLAMI